MDDYLDGSPDFVHMSHTHVPNAIYEMEGLHGLAIPPARDRQDPIQTSQGENSVMLHYSSDILPSLPTTRVDIPDEAKQLLRAILNGEARVEDIPPEFVKYFELMTHPSNSLYVDIVKAGTAQMYSLSVTPSLPPSLYMHAAPEIHDSSIASRSSNFMYSPYAVGPSSSSIVNPVADSAGLECRWNHCSGHFVSSRFMDIEYHLRQSHFNEDDNIWSSSRRGHCQWAHCQWKKPMLYRSFAKHVATQHLRSTTVVCAIKDCNEEFTRQDSMRRHLLKVHHDVEHEE